jgi:hypothetical protein
VRSKCPKGLDQLAYASPYVEGKAEHAERLRAVPRPPRLTSTATVPPRPPTNAPTVAKPHAPPASPLPKSVMHVASNSHDPRFQNSCALLPIRVSCDRFSTAAAQQSDHPARPLVRSMI